MQVSAMRCGFATAAPRLIDLLMGLFGGAVFRHGWGAGKQPIKQPTEMPTSTMALMGRFPSLMGRFLTLMGHFTDFVLRGRFTSRKSTGKQPIKKRGIKRFLKDRRYLGGVRQFAWNHLESVSCHFAEQLQPLSTKHSRDVTRQFSKKSHLN